MSELEDIKQIQDAFLKSRDGAIVHCASIMINTGRKDLAKQILEAMRIDLNRFKELKAQNTLGRLHETNFCYKSSGI